MLYYSSSENEDADQLRSYCEADLRLCFRIGKIPVVSLRISFSFFLMNHFKFYSSRKICILLGRMFGNECNHVTQSINSNTLHQ